MSPESVFNLSPSEKLQLVEDLWDDLSGNPAEIPIHQWQKDELDRRKQLMQNSLSGTDTWDEVRERIRKHHGG